MTPQSPSKQAPWDLTQFSQSPLASLSYFPESYQWSDISSLSKVILVLGKARGHREPIWAVGKLSHLGDLMFHQKLCMRHDTWTGMLSWWSCQSPVAHSCSLLNHPNGFNRGSSSLTQNLMHIFNETTTQYTCSLNSIYHPHWLEQWSYHCSCMCIPVYSPWLPGHIDVTQTVLVISLY